MSFRFLLVILGYSFQFVNAQDCSAFQDNATTSVCLIELADTTQCCHNASSFYRDFCAFTCCNAVGPCTDAPTFQPTTAPSPCPQSNQIADASCDAQLSSQFCCDPTFGELCQASCCRAFSMGLTCAPVTPIPTAAPSCPPDLLTYDSTLPSGDVVQLSACPRISELDPCCNTSYDGLCATYCCGLTCSPTSSPTHSPSSMPTLAPTSSPTAAPTGLPTDIPSRSPSGTPSAYPTMSPSAQPSFIPTSLPSEVPSSIPTSSAPSGLPTGEPSSSAPSIAPTISPTTSVPSLAPSKIPSTGPSEFPSSSLPTVLPTQSFPTAMPSISPTRSPTRSPTTFCSSIPCGLLCGSVTAGCDGYGWNSFNEKCELGSTTSNSELNAGNCGDLTQPPSSAPDTDDFDDNFFFCSPATCLGAVRGRFCVNPGTSICEYYENNSTRECAVGFVNCVGIPTVAPTRTPTVVPTQFPSQSPSKLPTNVPSGTPSAFPTSAPSTITPSSNPTRQPTVTPTRLPSTSPSQYPTNLPTLFVYPGTCQEVPEPEEGATDLCRGACIRRFESNSTHRWTRCEDAVTFPPTTSSPTSMPSTLPTSVNPTMSPFEGFPSVAPSISPSTRSPSSSPSSSLPTSWPTLEPSESPTPTTTTTTPMRTSTTVLTSVTSTVTTTTTTSITSSVFRASTSFTLQMPQTSTPLLSTWQYQISLEIAQLLSVPSNRVDVVSLDQSSGFTTVILVGTREPGSAESLLDHFNTIVDDFCVVLEIPGESNAVACTSNSYSDTNSPTISTTSTVEATTDLLRLNSPLPVTEDDSTARTELIIIIMVIILVIAIAIGAFLYKHRDQKEASSMQYQPPNQATTFNPTFNDTHGIGYSPSRGPQPSLMSSPGPLYLPGAGGRASVVSLSARPPSMLPAYEDTGYMLYPDEAKDQPHRRPPSSLSESYLDVSTDVTTTEL